MKKTSKKRKGKSESLYARILIIVLTFLVLIIVASMTFRFSERRKSFPGNAPIPYTRVEVLNGCGVDNLAYKVSLFLREKGFDVVEISNVREGDVERTIVIERMNTGMRNAKLLGKMIHCSNMTTMIDSTLFVEATLLLGKDYSKYFSKKVLEREIY